MTEHLVDVGDGVSLCVDEHGDRGDPALLLLGGATSSMDWWPLELCERLAAGGRHVLRLDARDTGRSTQWPAGAPTYAAQDLADDVTRVLDALDLPAAHLVGVSMGGGIAQDVALRRPHRVLSLTLVATSCAFDRAASSPLPGPEPRIAALFEQPPSDPDWSDAEAVAWHLVEGHRPYAGSLGLDEEETLATARRVVERTPDVRASLTNHWVVVGGDGASEPRTMAELSALQLPVLVVHGSDDPLFPLPHGEALAAEIAGARLLVVPGMGHEVPPRATWDLVVPAVLAL